MSPTRDESITRLRIILGFVAGAIFIASSGAHSLLGWPQLERALLQAQAPPDLVRNLEIGWHFGGAVMLTFGCMVVWMFDSLRRGRLISLRPALMIAIVYILFGIWALVRTLNPFFLVFVIPGLMLFAAAGPPGRDPTLFGGGSG